MAAAALMISEPASQVLFQVLFIAIPGIERPAESSLIDTAVNLDYSLAAGRA
jgi:hypothetical protein